MNSDVSSKNNTQMQRRKKTRERVLQSACRLFGENGFEKTSLRDIAADAGLTISPIYHYFENKLNLFAVVNELMEQDIIAMLDGFIIEEQNFALEQGWDVFLQLCKKPGFVQVVLIDSPHVLGHERWKASLVLRKAYELFTSRQTSSLHSSAAPTGISSQLSALDQELLMHMLMAALAEAALMVGRNPDYDSSPIINGILALLQA